MPALWRFSSNVGLDPQIPEAPSRSASSPRPRVYGGWMEDGSPESRGWLGPVSGLLFFAAVLISAAVFGGFDFFGGVEVLPSHSPGVLITALQAKGDSIRNSSLIMLVGIGFLGLFVADLRARSEEAGLGWPTEAFSIGGGLISAAWLVYLGLQLAAHVVGDNGQAESARVVIALLWLAFWLFLPGVLVFGIAAAVSGLRSTFHPKWLGVIGVLTALTAFVPWDGLFVFVIWVAAASVARLLSLWRS